MSRTNMIPLYKMEKLPRIQKLRKIAKIFAMAENRLCMADEKKGLSIFSTAEFVFFTDAAKMLAGDSLFPADTQKTFKETADIFEQILQEAVQSTGGLFQHTVTVQKVDPDQQASPAGFRLTLNRVKNLLFTETGREQADWDFISCEGRLDPAQRQVFPFIWVYMEDIRSPFNVGAIFRTAESFGVEKIFLSRFCADPNHVRARRTAMGCVEILPWERRELFTESQDLYTEVKDAPGNEQVSCLPESLACPVFALETGGVPLPEFSFPRRGLLIAGSEELGVSPRALSIADASLGRVSIPCYGAKGSLNVSVAFGIVMQAWAEQQLGMRNEEF